MAFCSNCGTKLEDGNKFCEKCGTAVSENIESPQVTQEETSNQPTPSDLSENDSNEETYDTQSNSKIKVNKKGVIIALILFLFAVVGIATKGAAPLRAKNSINLGNKYLQEGKYQKAMLAFEKANLIDEENIDSRLKLSEIYIITGKNDKAKSLLKETVQLDKTFQDTYILLASIYEKEKDYGELIKVLNEGLSLCKEKDKLQEEFDKLLAEINIPDIEASVEQDEKYNLPELVQLQIGEDKFELPVEWTVKNIDTSIIKDEKLEGNIKYINKPVIMNIHIEIKPVVVTEKKITKEEKLYSINYSIPVVRMEGEYSDNVDKLNSAIQEHFNKVNSSNLEMADKASEDDFIMPDMKYKFDAKYKVVYNKDGLVSILMTYYFYTGGAHGYGYKVAYNYDIIEGKELKLQDLFSKDADSYSIVKQEVVKQMREDTDSFFFEGHGIDVVKKYSEPFNFYFTEQGVFVWFGEYEVGPYAAGMPEFLITSNVVIK
jgi:tetratricopeptide (TPR) repeat protein